MYSFYTRASPPEQLELGLLRPISQLARKILGSRCSGVFSRQHYNLQWPKQNIPRRFANCNEMSPPSIHYLFAYNSLQALGWAFALFKILSSFVITKSVHGAYASAGELICLLQTVAFLEVVHAFIGIVPSGVVNTLMQWGGRVHFLLVVVRQIDEVQELPSVFITFVAWSLTEVIRYPHYALNCIGHCPSWITYLRYTAFIVLYPTGLVPGEMWLMYQALEFIKKKHLHEDLFNGLPFSYYNFLKVLLLCYPFLGLKLYLHMFKQRRSKLGKHHKKKRI